MNPAVMRRGVPFALASKTGEEGEVYMHIYIYIFLLFIYLFFFFFGVFPPSPFEQVPLYGEATLRSWGALLLYALVCGMTDQPII